MLYLRILVLVMLLVSCKETYTNPDGDDHEFVTTVKLVVEASATGVSSTYYWEDLDGPGGLGPNRIDTIRLSPSSAYVVTVSVLNNSIAPPDDFTQVIIDEADVHQFFYTDDIDDVAIIYLDKDVNNKPLGQRIKINTGQGASGILGIILSHYANASDKNGVDMSDETDVSVILPMLIQ